ncbi:hypothetical protein ODV97_04005 [Enterococcus gallinarum]|nr:hypothetical protein [Enterococcus gallinarum]
MAWDDIGSQSKFMIVNTQKGYQGIYGHLSTEVKKESVLYVNMSLLSPCFYR